MTITVIIPCYNVSRHIDEVIESLPAEISWIIAVNDCSKDDTVSVLQKIQQENNKVIVINHETNQGVGGAMLSGYKKALELESDIMIKMDGDNQMDSRYIPDLITPIIEDRADYTKGNRFRDFKALKKMPLVRRFGNLGLSFLIKAASGYWNIFDPNNGFVAISKDTLRAIDFNKIHKRYFFESSMLIELYHADAVILEIPMKARYGDEVSHLSLTRTLFGFPPKLLKAFIRRILLKYFLFEFNIASLFMIIGIPSFLLGTIYGLINYVRYAKANIAAPTGTVVIPTLLIILGFQLILSAITYDITNYPKRANGK